MVMGPIMPAQYILKGEVTAGSMIERILHLGFSPIQVTFSGRGNKFRATGQEDGVVDSLKYLTAHDNFIKAWSNEHVLTVLLTRCF